MKRTDLIILTMCIVAGLMGAGLGKSRAGLSPPGAPWIPPQHGPSR